LLRYIVDLVQEQDPSLLDLGQEFARVREASKILFGGLSTDLKDLQAELKLAETALEEVVPMDGKFERFFDKLKAFLPDASAETRRLVDDFRALEEQYKETAEFFAENPSATQCHEFCGMFIKFIDQIQHTVQIKEAQQELLKEQQRAREAQERLRQRAGGRHARPVPKIGEESTANADTAFGDLLDKMVGGENFRRRRRPGRG
jgi:Formin Homology 2 Domain